MGHAATESTEYATSFQGKQCGGTFTPGEMLTLDVSGGGTYKLEISGAAINDDQAQCDGTRFSNLGTSRSSYSVTPSAGSQTVEAWIGRGTGPTTADMPVMVYQKCSLTAASNNGGSVSSPPTAGTPTISPPPIAKPPPPAVMDPVTPSTSGLSAVFCFEDDCNFMVRFTEISEPHSVEVTLRLRRMNAWLGVGISPTWRMGSDAIGVINSWVGSDSQSHMYRLEGRTPDAIKSGWLGISQDAIRSRQDGESLVVIRIPYSDRCGSRN